MIPSPLWGRAETFKEKTLWFERETAREGGLDIMTPRPASANGQNFQEDTFVGRVHEARRRA